MFEFLSFCVTQHLYDGRESCDIRKKKWLISGNLAIWTVLVLERSVILTFLSSSKKQNSVTNISVGFRTPRGVSVQISINLFLLLFNKLTSLPMRGFIAQLVEYRTSIAEITSLTPLRPCCRIFFRLLLFSFLTRNIYCNDHSSLSSTTAVQIWIISYLLHIMSNLSAGYWILKWNMTKQLLPSTMR